MHVCLFDIDGTLLSSGGAGKAAMEAALSSQFAVPASSADVPYSGRTDRAIVRDLFRLHAIEQSEQNWLRFVAGYLGLLPSHLESHKGRVLPGMSALLQTLSKRNDVAVGLLTGNIQHGARLKLSHYGIFDHFAFGAFGDSYYDRDAVACEALEVIHRRHNGTIRSERIWVIGDTPLDVQCARHIGARAVAVATGWTSLEALRASQPDLLFENLLDPTPLLDQLNGAAPQMSISSF
jgi:phosphoglycolate phosphatase-like HAD superfamily hydrolase